MNIQNRLIGKERSMYAHVWSKKPNSVGLNKKTILNAFDWAEWVIRASNSDKIGKEKIIKFGTYWKTEWLLCK